MRACRHSAVLSASLRPQQQGSPGTRKRRILCSPLYPDILPRRPVSVSRSTSSASSNLHRTTSSRPARFAIVMPRNPRSGPSAVSALGLLSGRNSAHWLGALSVCRTEHGSPWSAEGWKQETALPWVASTARSSGTKTASVTGRATAEASCTGPHSSAPKLAVSRGLAMEPGSASSSAWSSCLAQPWPSTVPQ